MTLGDLLRDAARRDPDRVFLLDRGSTITYGTFDERANALARSLTDLGVRRGERVAVVLANGVELLCTWFALARLGAIMAPVNPALAPAEVEPLLAGLGAVALVADARGIEAHARPGLRVAISVGAETPPAAIPFADLAHRAASPPSSTVAANDPVAILLTSGTSGRPKGCLLRHESYVIPAREFVGWMEVDAADRCFGCLPLFHLAGQAFLVSALAAGASYVIADRFRAGRFWAQVRECGATLFRYLAEMLAVLGAQPGGPDDRAHRLRAVYGGGARPDTIAAFERRFGVPVVEGYGLTETNTVLRNTLRRRRIGSIGWPAPYCDVRVLGDDGREAAPGQIGEIEVRRNRVMLSGYVGAPDPPEPWRGGWFPTGDLGTRDDEGFFYHVGRKKEIIRRRGENVAPAEIERVLERHPAVAVSAVVGVPDEFGGEEIKAYVVLCAGHDTAADAIVEWCRAHLAEFKVPRYVEVCADLPRTSTSKIDRARLAAAGTAGGRCVDRAAAERMIPHGPGRATARAAVAGDGDRAATP